MMLLKNLLPTLEILISASAISYLGRFLDSWIGLQSLTLYFVFMGVVILLTGVFIRLWATVAFSRHQVKVLQLSAPSTLVQDGPYAYSRHPLYVGILLVGVGIALIFGSASALLFCGLLFVFGNWWIKNREEPSLVEKFGELYEKYMRSVNRWI